MQQRRKRIPTTELVPRDRDKVCGSCARCGAKGVGEDHGSPAACIAYWRNRGLAADLEIFRLQKDVSRLQRMLGRKRGEPSKIEELTAILRALEERIDYIEHRPRPLTAVDEEPDDPTSQLPRRPLSRSGQM